MRRALAACKMELLHPQSPSGSNVNDASIVVRLTFGEGSFARRRCGTGKPQTNNKPKQQTRSTILKVSHGSRTSFLLSFAVSPKAAVIMCGKGNPYGHPHAETLTLLASKVDIYRTDLHGTIVISTDGKSLPLIVLLISIIIQAQTNLKKQLNHNLILPTVPETGES